MSALDTLDAAPQVDYIVPATGQATGSLAATLLNNDLDVGCMRPYTDTRNSYITRTTGLTPRRDRASGQLVFNKDGTIAMDRTYKKVRLTNNDATLRFLDWIQIDNAVIKAAKPRLRAARDLEARGLVYTLPNGIAKTVLQYQQQSDISGASISMDALRENESDRPVFSLLTFPVPIIHKDFQFSLRQILESRTGQSPLDTTTAELAGRRVAEQVEQLVLGEAASSVMLGVNSYTAGGGTIYGFKNFPGRLTYSLTLPTSPGWTPAATLDDVLAMITLAQQSNHFGPFMLYVGLGWSKYMDGDYKPTYNDTTLRQRLRVIDGIIDVQTVDYISDLSIIMVMMDPQVVRLVKGMDLTTVQWMSHGGFQLNFKVMTVVLPMLRTDYYGNSGIVHGA